MQVSCPVEVCAKSTNSIPLLQCSNPRSTNRLTEKPSTTCKTYHSEHICFSRFFPPYPTVFPLLPPIVTLALLCVTRCCGCSPYCRERGYLKHATQARHETPRQAPSAKSKSACQAPCTAKVCRKGIREAVLTLTFQLGKMPSRIFLGHLGGKSFMKMQQNRKVGIVFRRCLDDYFSLFYWGKIHWSHGIWIGGCLAD